MHLPLDTPVMGHTSACSLQVGQTKLSGFLYAYEGLGRAGPCWDGGREGWYHGVACGGNTAVPGVYWETMRKKIVGVPGEVSCRAGHQGTGSCMALFVLQVSLTAGRKPSFFGELVITISCAAQITDCEPQYVYCLVCTSSSAVLVSQVLLMEITGTDGSASLGFWPLQWKCSVATLIIKTEETVIRSVTQLTKRSFLRKEHLTSLNSLLFDGRGWKLYSRMLLYTTGSMHVSTVSTILWPNW